MRSSVDPLPVDAPCAPAAPHAVASLLDAVDHGMALLDASGRLVASNTAWTSAHAVLLEQAPQPGDDLAAALTRTRQRRYREHLARRDGRWLELRWPGERWLRARFAPVAGGGLLAMLIDATAQRSRERELLEDAERFRAYAEVSGDWLWELDEQLRYTWVAGNANGAAAGDAPPGASFLESLRALAVEPDDVGPIVCGLRAREPFRDVAVRLRDAHGAECVASLSAAPFAGSDGRFRGFRGIGRNITEASELASRLAHQAHHDDLTGLANRRALEQRIGALLSEGDDGTRHALLFLDMDQIKVINDTCGHAAGDALLGRVARRLREALRGAETVARVGGDEFAILLRDCDAERAMTIAQKICDSLQKRPFVWQGQHFRVTASIGVALLDPHMHDATGVMGAADSACYAAKESGRNRTKLYALDDSTLNIRQGEMHWVARLHRALAEKRFELYLQPIAPAAGDGAPHRHFETLLRLNAADGRCFTPGAFMPAAERYNLASQIDAWVLDEALAWLDRSPLFLDQIEVLSINLSGQSLGEAAFLGHVRDRMRRFPLAARKICFEITETAAISNLDRVQDFMASLRALGCRFALDDFGAGLSSFAYLRTLDVDYLKIDGMFIRDLEDDPVHVAMVRSINEVGHVMGKKTIAEYVENDAVRERLAALGVDLVQGYGIGRPVPFADVV